MNHGSTLQDLWVPSLSLDYVRTVLRHSEIIRPAVAFGVCLDSVFKLGSWPRGLGFESFRV